MQSGLGLTRNRHGNQFHTRICIPKDLVLQLGRKEIRISLGTEQRRYAIWAARLVHARKITAFDEMRSVMNNSNASPTPEKQNEARERLLLTLRQAKEILLSVSAEEEEADAAWYTAEVDDRQEDRQVQVLLANDPEATTAFVEVMRDQRAARHAAEASTCAALVALQEAEASREAAIQVAATNINAAAEAKQQAEKSAREHAATVGRMVLEGAAERARTAEEHANQLASVSIAALARTGKSLASEPEQTQLMDMPFSEVAKRWLEKKERGREGKPATSQERLKKYRSYLDRFIWATGNPKVSEITHKTYRQYWDVEMAMDRGFRFKEEHKKIAVEKLLKTMKNPIGVSGFKHIVDEKSECIRNTISSASRDAEWSDKGWVIPDAALRAFDIAKGIVQDSSGMELRELKKRSKTRNFNDEELKLYFSGVNTGYAKREFVHPYEYWLPLILWLTGARPNEICQMNASDVRTEGEIAFFSIETDDADLEEGDSVGRIEKSLKTETSIRDVPIDKILINLGFVDYVEEMRRGEGR